ncbi:hypothetical protein [Methanobrevibacter sp.]|uniref:hypothetical protein n=1 Tax=Methanobrevibacter sp. TaxID=66852 RepID=UPI00386B1887
MSKSLVANIDVIDSKFIEEFVKTPAGLPILLMNILDEVDENVELKRMNVYKIHPEFEVLDREEIKLTSEILKNGNPTQAEDFQLQYALDFLKKYPQFQKMISGVESGIDKDFKIMVNSIKEAFLGDFDYF